MIQTKYNFVIFGHNWDLYRCAFADIEKTDGAIYIPGNKPKKNTLKGFLYRTHFRPELNKNHRLPFLKLWNGLYFQDNFKSKKPICFIFLVTFASYAKETEYISYLRKHYNDCKIILFMTDLLIKSKNIFTGVPLSVDYLKNNFDLILSYDRGECEKYGLVYHPTVFSHVEFNNDQIPSCDIFFAAKYKGRLPLVVDIYDQLSNVGLNCDFYIYGTPLEKKIEREGIHYIDKLMSYRENLAYASKANCLLEILQSNADGYSYRTWEALSYNKYLLTNNHAIVGAPFFNEEYISVISDNKKIDDDFIIKLKSGKSVAYNYNEQMSPLRLLEFIDKYFG